MFHSVFVIIPLWLNRYVLYTCDATNDENKNTHDLKGTTKKRYYPYEPQPVCEQSRKIINEQNDDRMNEQHTKNVYCWIGSRISNVFVLRFPSHDTSNKKKTNPNPTHKKFEKNTSMRKKRLTHTQRDSSSRKHGFTNATTESEKN